MEYLMAKSMDISRAVGVIWIDTLHVILTSLAPERDTRLMINFPGEADTMWLSLVTAHHGQCAG